LPAAQRVPEREQSRNLLLSANRRKSPMKNSSSLLLLILTAAAPTALTACPTASKAEQEADLVRQHERVRDLVARADLIVEARATASPSRRASEFDVTRTLKGKPQSKLSLSWNDSMTVGCRPSDSFEDVHINGGTTYLLYVRSGKLLRAALTDRREGELEQKDEEALIRKQATP
jgi:hypothetical protein